ncbi:retrovirus-related pol polyprotein from transposon TNT 1-94 [Tanacetum coccineum]
MEIMYHIERQLTQSQSGWVDNPAKTLWIHRTLPKNSQKETPFSLTYGSEAVIPIIKTIDDRGRAQKTTKGKERKEVASIEKAYYQNKLRKYHSARSSHPMYIMGEFVLPKRNTNEWQGPYIINEVHKEEVYTIVDTTDHLLVQTKKGTSLRDLHSNRDGEGFTRSAGGDIGFEMEQRMK